MAGNLALKVLASGGVYLGGGIPPRILPALEKDQFMGAVQAANSGHPGMSMVMAPVVYNLWQNYLRFDPEDPIWPNRDRFMLSIGHASTLLYAILHLTGVRTVNSKYETLGELSVTLDDIKHFRQLDSRTPGHPEYRWTSGIETTTGPLGQGVATSVGMAIGSRWMGEYFNQPGFEMFDFDVYALAGDGCMVEGVASEAASLAGHLELSEMPRRFKMSIVESFDFILEETPLAAWNDWSRR